MSRHSLIATGLAAGALALTACGGGGSSAGGDPEVLIDASYVVTSFTVGDPEREVQGPVTISFTADSISVDTPCNDMGATVEYSPTTLTVGPVAATQMACEPALMEQDQLIANVLTGNPTWDVADGILTLTSGSTTITAEATADGVAP
ncbi:MAG: META domain-containing protein [Actinobacteria bacterium]|nr:META domain-containing protein [Actinomycetota bacterium]